jgi:hypothetical protein
VSDAAAAKKAESITETSGVTTEAFYFFTFLLTLLLARSMENFWGSVRTLKSIFVLSLVQFAQTPLMTTFLHSMS